MVKKTQKKPIQPHFFHDKNGKPTEVFLTLEDFNALMAKLERLEKEVALETKATSKKTTKK